MEKEIAWILNEKYGGISSAAFDADVARLRAGEPLDYIIGWTPFAGVQIHLDSHPLIPRTETEFWVAEAIVDIQNRELKRMRVLDLCAGSGCIGIAIMNAFPNATVHFAEIDERHHDTIRKNIYENGLEKQNVSIIGGNLFENISDSYDVIVTNPPYIDPSLSNRIDASVLTHEPHQALFGGTHGTELLKIICEQAPLHLNAKGVLYIEHEPEQAEFMQQHLLGSTQHADQFGVIRYTMWQK